MKELDLGVSPEKPAMPCPPPAPAEPYFPTITVEDDAARAILDQYPKLTHGDEIVGPARLEVEEIVLSDHPRIRFKVRAFQPGTIGPADDEGEEKKHG